MNLCRSAHGVSKGCGQRPRTGLLHAKGGITKIAGTLALIQREAIGKPVLSAAPAIRVRWASRKGVCWKLRWRTIRQQGVGVNAEGSAMWLNGVCERYAKIGSARIRAITTDENYGKVSNYGFLLSLILMGG